MLTNIFNPIKVKQFNLSSLSLDQIRVLFQITEVTHINIQLVGFDINFKQKTNSTQHL